MIQLRHRQPRLCDAFWAEEVSDLWEPWMRAADALLEDEELLDKVYDAQAKRHRKSRTRGRKQTPSEVVLRLLILKHARNWSYDVLDGKCAPTLSIATSHGSEARKCRMPRRWFVWGSCWDRKSSSNCMGEWWISLASTR